MNYINAYYNPRHNCIDIIHYDSYILRIGCAKAATELAYAEVISYNRKNLERELQNESRQHNRQQGKVKRREEEIL